MNQQWQMPVPKNLVSAEPTPYRLYVCSARIKPEAGSQLKNTFDKGIPLAGDLENTYNQHLVYTHHLGDTYFEAGPSADFTEILYIFSTENMAEAQTTLRNDPLFKSGIIYEDSWFTWEIHSPRWKIAANFREADEKFLYSAGLLPQYPPEIKQSIGEIIVDNITPPRLFACFSKMNRGILNQWLSPHSKTASVVMVQHVYNCAGQGGAGSMGYHWLSGPSVDYTLDLSIFSVNSLFMAQLIKENDSFSRYGIFYDFRYFEWCIHMPFRKASPQHKETLKRLMEKAGIKV
jgi:hypothetical protein